MISSLIADRVRRLVPLLASPFDGEVIATRNEIGRELSASGTDWHDLAASVHGIECSSPPAPQSRGIPSSFGDLARACRDWDQGRLKQHERVFVEQMCRLGFNRRPSEKQAEWLRSIFDRLQRRAAA